MKSFLCLAACTVLLSTACQRPAATGNVKSAAEETRNRPVVGLLGAKPSPAAQGVSAPQAASVQAAAGQQATGGSAPVRRVLDPPFKSTEVARFNQPWAMTFLPDGRLLVTGPEIVRHEPDGTVVRHVDLGGLSPTGWSEIVRRLLSDPSLPDEERQERFVAEALQELRRTVGETEAGQYSRAGRLDYSWQGLARYWRKRAG
jgi:glucose/arabinose dehydrogenase